MHLRVLMHMYWSESSMECSQLDKVLKYENGSVLKIKSSSCSTAVLRNFYLLINSIVFYSLVNNRIRDGQYQSITALISDIRCSIENCYNRYWFFSYEGKQAKLLETIMEQKLALLPRYLYIKDFNISKLVFVFTLSALFFPSRMVRTRVLSSECNND